jgi:hypothetical protein
MGTKRGLSKGPLLSSVFRARTIGDAISKGLTLTQHFPINFAFW